MNTHRWISARGNTGKYAALRQQADNAELCHALTLASSALCVGWNADAVRAEMDARLRVAFGIIDDGYDYADWMEDTQAMRAGF